MKKILGVILCLWLSVASAAYNIGDTGPGGGKIFLTPTSTDNMTGMYFEAATSDITTGIQ